MWRSKLKTWSVTLNPNSKIAVSASTGLSGTVLSLRIPANQQMELIHSVKTPLQIWGAQSSAINTQSYHVGSQMHTKEHFCLCVAVVVKSFWDGLCCKNFFFWATWESQGNTDNMPQPPFLLKRLFSTIVGLHRANKQRQSQCECKAAARASHHLGEIFKTHRLPQRMRFRGGRNNECQGN